jgi:hypothetical protein
MGIIYLTPSFPYNRVLAVDEDFSQAWYNLGGNICLSEIE